MSPLNIPDIETEQCDFKKRWAETRLNKSQKIIISPYFPTVTLLPILKARGDQKIQ